MAGWIGVEGEWEDDVMRRGELKTADGMRYVGEFADDGRCFLGRSELWLKDGLRHFDGEWEKQGGSSVCGFARRGMAVDSDGAVHRVEFEGEWGAWWGYMERAFDEKQAFRIFGCTSASWTLLPVRARGAHECGQLRQWCGQLRQILNLIIATQLSRHLAGSWQGAPRMGVLPFCGPRA